jgi:hypothetical protein
MPPRKRPRGVGKDGASSTGDEAGSALHRPLGTPVPTKLLIARHDHMSAFHESFAALWRQGKLCDVKIFVDSGESFSAHKIVLAAGSDYFKALFTSGMRDSAVSQVTVSEVDAGPMQDILAYLYEQRLEVTPSTLHAIMRAASRLEVAPLLSLAGEFLISELSIDNCVESWSVALDVGRPELEALRTACEHLAARQFMLLAARPEFSRLTADQLKPVLACDNLAAKEEEAFETVAAWIDKRDPPLTSDASKLELLSLIRYPHMEAKFLASRVEGVLGDIEGGQALLFEGARTRAARAPPFFAFSHLVAGPGGTGAPILPTLGRGLLPRASRDPPQQPLPFPLTRGHTPAQLPTQTLTPAFARLARLVFLLVPAPLRVPTSCFPTSRCSVPPQVASQGVAGHPIAPDAAPHGPDALWRAARAPGRFFDALDVPLREAVLARNLAARH